MPFEDYTKVKYLGKGGYGEVFKVKNKYQGLDLDEFYAMKIVKGQSRRSLKLEKKILEQLGEKYQNSIDKGFPQILEYGTVNEYEDYLVMTLHGEKVSVLKEFYTTKDKHDKVINIVQQVIR
mmetsp:Transcript_32086/g.28449  ORF Transcript_32086/g.28449 Transcript_32086/m.28449 type:complete len:122 (+) Transcript_32086:1-366(+)